MKLKNFELLQMGLSLSLLVGTGMYIGGSLYVGGTIVALSAISFFGSWIVLDEHPDWFQ